MKKIPYIVTLLLVASLLLEWVLLSRALLLLVMAISAFRVLVEPQILIPESDPAEKLCYVAIISFAMQSIIILTMWILKFPLSFFFLAMANITLIIAMDAVFMLKKLLEKKYELFRNM